MLLTTVIQGSVNISIFDFSLNYYILNGYATRTADDSKYIFYNVTVMGSL